ncbi:MAG TPA: hypothetical protein DET40_06395 [Lentisphaeria bacterium]|nr:MAG: hypothetical protein A2X45_17735 [Lentisphaerae bacterium GWF2_50_93]HCE43157.1 hypothetical protein [Lentisphaeria bacterium]
MISNDNIKVMTKTAQTRQRIEDLIGNLEPGDQLLPEGKLAERFGVSVITIKRSLGELVKDGSVYKRQGKGTFVAEKRADMSSDPSTVNLVYPFVPKDTFKDPFLGQVINGIGDCFAVNSCHLRLFPLHGKSTIEICLKNPATRKMISSGIIAVNYLFTEKDQKAISNYNCPAVFIGKPETHIRIPSVNTDHFSAGYDATIHLVKKHSRKRIAVLTHLDRRPYCIDMIEGHRKALKDSGIPEDGKLLLSLKPGLSMSTLVDELVMKKTSFDSMIVWGCEATIEALTSLKHHGIDVPGEVSLISYDDFPVVSEYSSPTITAVRQQVYDLGYEAARLMLKQKNSGFNGRENLASVLKNTLVIRESCGCRG